MTVKHDYESEEWETLMDVPAMVGLAVMVSGRSGLGSLKESLAIAHGLLELPGDADHVELLQALHESRVKDGERSSVEGLSSPMRGKTPDQLRDAALDRCRQAHLVLEARATRQELQAYKRWVLQIAERVASAAKEGGFLGFGGERVSAAEEETIAAIADALEGKVA